MLITIVLAELRNGCRGCKNFIYFTCTHCHSGDHSALGGQKSTRGAGEGRHITHVHCRAGVVGERTGGAILGLLLDDIVGIVVVYRQCDREDGFSHRIKRAKEKARRQLGATAALVEAGKSLVGGQLSERVERVLGRYADSSRATKTGISKMIVIM